MCSFKAPLSPLHSHPSDDGGAASQAFCSRNLLARQSSPGPRPRRAEMLLGRDKSVSICAGSGTWNENMLSCKLWLSDVTTAT